MPSRLSQDEDRLQLTRVQELLGQRGLHVPYTTWSASPGVWRADRVAADVATMRVVNDRDVTLKAFLQLLQTPVFASDAALAEGRTTAADPWLHVVRVTFKTLRSRGPVPHFRRYRISPPECFIVHPNVGIAGTADESARSFRLGQELFLYGALIRVRDPCPVQPRHQVGGALRSARAELSLGWSMARIQQLVADCRSKYRSCSA